MIKHVIIIVLLSNLPYIINKKHKSKQTESTRRCISRTFYRKSCNVCWCPEHGKVDENLCTKSVCGRNSKFKSLNHLTDVTSKCHPNSFRKAKCIYCKCNTSGYISKNACLELDCLKTNDFTYNATTYKCGPGEMVPICLECFCLADGTTNKAYCSEVCSEKSKLQVLENVLKDSKEISNLIAKDKITRASDSESCEPNSMYVDQGRYCLCPENGSTRYELCIFYTDDIDTSQTNKDVTDDNTLISLNASCTPNTFVEFDCNTCYCSKNGSIDPKWCTNDDCNVKRTIENRLKAKVSKIRSSNYNSTCVPGTITIADCNYCICPESGLLRERACTNNKCTDVGNVIDYKFTCEPLAYYLVDCNVCLCPNDGVKNVQKCTKYMCDKTLLRSDSCMPGDFFSNDCNVCVCPPNGVKADKVCTNHICFDSENAWNKTLIVTQSILGDHKSKPKAENRDLDVCFSGEQYEVGCQICVCPDVGLRSYAKCTNTMCKDNSEQRNNNLNSSESMEGGEETDIGLIQRSKRDQTNCFTLNMSDSSERKECTPGSTYIIRCKQCVCPYLGNINYFCRELPKGRYCEQAYPNFNYLSMGRRLGRRWGEGAKTNVTEYSDMDIHAIFPNETKGHYHTKYSCSKPGTILDDCFICECEENGTAVIEEHCFKSNDEKCVNAVPTFLDKVNKKVLV